MKSRVNREVQARFCERFGGEIPPYLLDFKSILLEFQPVDSECSFLGTQIIVS